MPDELKKLFAAMQRQATNDKSPLKSTPRLVAKGKKIPKTNLILNMLFKNKSYAFLK